MNSDPPYVFFCSLLKYKNHIIFLWTIFLSRKKSNQKYKKIPSFSISSTGVVFFPNSPSPKQPTKGTLGNNVLNIFDSTFFSSCIWLPRALHANINPTECFINLTRSLNDLNFASICSFVLQFLSTIVDHVCILPVIKITRQYGISRQLRAIFLVLQSPLLCTLYGLLLSIFVQMSSTTPPHKETISLSLLKKRNVCVINNYCTLYKHTNTYIQSCKLSKLQNKGSKNFLYPTHINSTVNINSVYKQYSLYI